MGKTLTPLIGVFRTYFNADLRPSVQAFRSIKKPRRSGAAKTTKDYLFVFDLHRADVGRL
jgi:hypothetical protein